MWNNMDMQARKQFMQNVSTTFFVLGLMILIALGFVGAVLHSTVITVVGIASSFVCEVITLFTWIWGDWVSTNIPQRRG